MQILVRALQDFFVCVTFFFYLCVLFDFKNIQTMPTANQNRSGRAKGSAQRKVVEVPLTDAFGNKQPQQLDFEMAVLGALLVEQESYEQVSNLLSPEAFYDHRHQVIYKAIQALQVNQRPVDIITVPQYLESQGLLEEAGGVVYVAQLAQNVVTSAHIEYQAQIIHQKFQARKLITFASRCWATLSTPPRTWPI